MQSEAAVPRVATSSGNEGLAYAGLGLATLGWASAFIAGKVVLAEMSPLPAATWRYVIAASVLLPFAARQRFVAADVRRAIGPLAFMAVCGGVLYPWLFLLSLSLTSATNTALLIALNPVFTLLLSPLIGERLDRHRLGGVALALAGAVAVISGGKWDAVGGLASFSLNSGDLLALGAACTWACFNIA